MSLFTITHRGVPLGSASIDATVGVVTVEFRPLAAFNEWRTLAVDVGKALRAAGFFGRDAAGASGMAPELRSAALDAGASWGHELELRGELAELVPTSFIEFAAVPDEIPPLYVGWIGFERLAAGVPAEQAAPPLEGSGTVPPR